MDGTETVKVRSRWGTTQAAVVGAPHALARGNMVLDAHAIYDEVWDNAVGPAIES